MSLNTANTPHPLPPHKGEGTASGAACPHIAPSPSWGGLGWGAAARRVSRSVRRPFATRPAIRRADPKHTPAIRPIWLNSETHP